ncbi:cytochrome P450 [Saccharothrix lopnurensis]|uniref:Cytochrome P450 n=1 Tax=Saccharothrix lopnurensis TaxID=1670621 RepID=A0ABW1NXW9_9PSEU
MPHTEAVVREVLRLWPPTWLMGRAAVRPTTPGEWEPGPEGQVMFSPYLPHRDPRWWPAADVLDPDRRLDPRRAPHKHSYVPFGAGPRVCVGTRPGAGLRRALPAGDPVPPAPALATGNR